MILWSLGPPRGAAPADLRQRLRGRSSSVSAAVTVGDVDLARPHQRHDKSTAAAAGATLLAVPRRLVSGVKEPRSIVGVQIIAGVDPPPFDAERQATATAAP